MPQQSSTGSVHYQATHDLKPLTGSDTISFGLGHDTILEQGQASVHGLFGFENLSKGSSLVTGGSDVSFDGKSTLQGGGFSPDFVAASGKSTMQVGLASLTDSSAGIESTAGGTSHNVFEFLSKEAGQHVITNFVPGHDQLYIDGQSFAQLQQGHEISTVGNDTLIKLHGGTTTIELKGVTDISKVDISTHKPS